MIEAVDLRGWGRMWPSIVFSIFLIVVSAVLSSVQLRSWRAACRRELNDRDRRFYSRQFRRRIQIDVMIGVVGVAVLGGLWINDAKAKFFYLPYSILYIIVYFQEVLFKIIGRTPILTRYRLKSSQKKIVYNGEKIYRELNWTPPVSLDDALNNMLEYEMRRKN